MGERIVDLSCSDFSAALAAKRSVPGGGGAAALCGAFAVALCTMAGNFTVGKKKYADVEEDVKRMIAEGERLRERLVALVDEDALSFEPLSRAYGIAKDDPTREETIEVATKAALQAPLQMMREICQSIDLLEEMEKAGSVMLLSDVGCGASLAAAALEMAAMNVYVNTKTLRDRAYASAVDKECACMLQNDMARARAIANRVITSMTGEEND
ncbi:cyclodeaminase/cyclohydrolase family protein [Adlercreutzia sp. ZJ138]|uniref:cyclodeaminase/cyclohydrolase family protein n=1 Tax=Adlercreutzia sp. ZJ138 TaxID=2709405 RepID=UPI0013EB50A5|nr:cyclodeaminase/cyclohydrolase family protein [Adlercreutzia sp. ZJ138]